MRKTSLKIAAVLFFAGIASSVGFSKIAYAVMGKAEEYDFFEADKLSEFHDSLVNEEKKNQFAKADELRAQLHERSTDLQKSQGKEKENLDEEIQNLKKQLLALPKRDRFKIEFSGSQTFDSNVNRQQINSEKNDSIFDSDGRMVFDLSGRKTDLRWEAGAFKQWNIEFPEKDTKGGEEVLRYRRRYFRKTFHSAQSRIARHNSKTVQINSEKVRWDSAQSTSTNYAMTTRFSINSDFSVNHRYFPQEAFDQDSSWDAASSPSLFWNITPKTRLGFGYRLGTTKIRTKAGNANVHEIHSSYFGKLTRKSSASLDLAFSHQIPKSRGTATVNTVTTGLGYIWQITPKTQLLVQYINSLQNSTSTAVGTLDSAATAETAVTKTSTFFHNNSISLSLNMRLSRKLTGVLTISPNYLSTHSKPKVESDGSQYGSPFTITLTYVVKRWLVLTSGYAFYYRWGDERTDHTRAHVWKNAARFVF